MENYIYLTKCTIKRIISECINFGSTNMRPKKAGTETKRGIVAIWSRYGMSVKSPCQAFYYLKDGSGKYDE